jgi:cytidylate kinase
VGEKVSALAAMPRVRAWVNAHLRSMTSFGTLVMEGRDIGTVVFPDTPFKFFLEADPEERARRRQKDLAAENCVPELNQIKTSLLRRDALDSGRATAPLARAAGVRVIDTTHLTIDAVVAQIVGKVRGED